MGVNFDINEMKQNIIYGIPLYDTEGNPFPDSLLQSYLDSAIAWAEQTFSIAIQPRQLTENHDYMASDYMNWAYIKLWKRPVQSVESLTLYYGTQPIMTIPQEWLKVDVLGGAIQIFPTTGGAGSLIVTGNGGLYMPLMTGAISYAPQMWQVTYTAGLSDPNPNNPQVYDNTTMHPDLKEIIYKRACIGIMGVWGDLIIGAGIANQSIGIDGLSQSVGTTQSAEYGGASARIKQLQDDIDRLTLALRSYYGGIGMAVI